MMKPGSATLRTVSCKNWLILQKVEKNNSLEKILLKISEKIIGFYAN